MSAETTSSDTTPAEGAAATAPAAASTKRPPLHSLTGLRFLAALMVFFFHLTLSNSPVPPNSPVNPFANAELASFLETLFSKAGYLGVSFFFVLSGFVITWSATPGEGALPFYRRRLLKIFPNHLVMFAAAMLLFAGATTRPGAWIPNVFLLHSMFPQGDVYVSVNPPSWTLCSELLFYLSFPFLIKPIKRIAASRLWLWTGAMVVGMVGVQLVTQYLVSDSPKSPITPISVTQFWFGYIFPVPRLFEFVIGMLVARAVMAGRFPRIDIRWSIPAIVLGYVAALKAPFVYGFSVASILPIVLVIGAFATADIRGERTGVNNKTWRWLGEISFGFYICQGVVIFYGRTLFGADPFSTPVAVLVAIALFIATLLAGWGLHALVERPMMRRFARPRPRRVATAVRTTTPATDQV